MKFQIPTFDRKQNPAGVYKITFNDKWFYIGSSKKLRSRFRTWKAMLTSPKYLKNINIRNILHEVQEVRIEIIRVYANENLIQAAETRLIKKFWSNELLLNRCPEGNTNKGRRPYYGYTPPAKPKKGLPTPKKPVGLFSKDGVLLREYPATGAAALDNKINFEEINTMIRGLRGPLRNGTFFKYKLADGSYQEPVKFKRKDVPAAAVNQYDMNWNFIKRHRSMAEAAKEIGGHKRNIEHVIKGTHRMKSYKGYRWKFA